MKINQKPNPEVTKTLEQEVIDFRHGLREAELVIGLKDNPAWQILQGNLKERLDRLDMQLDQFEKLPERELVLCLKERKDFRWMVEITDRLEEGLPKLQAALAESERRLADRKATGAAR